MKPHEPRSNDILHRFIARFTRWLRRQLGLEQLKPPGTLEGKSDRATLWRINSDEPGVVCCWWICHQDASADLVVSVISIAQLREDLGRGRSYRRSTDPIRISQSNFRASLEAYLELQGGLDMRFISHVFAVAWRSRVPHIRTDRGGSERRDYLVRPLGGFPGDFQGLTNAWASGDRHALRIAEVIARRLLRTQSNLHSWESIVDRIDWLEWLDFYAKKSLGATHVLQPAKHQPSSDFCQ